MYVCNIRHVAYTNSGVLSQLDGYKLANGDSAEPRARSRAIVHDRGSRGYSNWSPRNRGEPPGSLGGLVRGGFNYSNNYIDTREACTTMERPKSCTCSC